MIYVIAAVILLAVSSPFLIRSLRHKPVFVPLPIFKGERRVVHNLGTVQEKDRTFVCYVVEEK